MWCDIKFSVLIFWLFFVGIFGILKNWKYRFLVNLVVDMVFLLEWWNMFVDLLVEMVFLCFKYINRLSMFCCYVELFWEGFSYEFWILWCNF